MEIALICLFSKIKYRIGGIPSLKSGPAFFITKKIFPIIKEHAIEEVLELSRQIGIDNKNPKIEIYVTKKEKQNVKNKLKKFKVKDYIIVHPGFGFAKENKYAARLWPLERYSKVIEYLVQNYPMTVLLTGLKDEKGLSEKIKAKIKNKKNVIITNGMFNYNELVALVSETELVFCPDTLLVHIAASFNKKIVELMGNGGPKKWHPWTAKENYRALFHPEVCTECYQLNCREKTTECLKAISVKEVINAIESLLDYNKI
jgi:ADP-heptose:LPS heptosyltransferase